MFTLYLLGLGLLSPWRDHNNPVPPNNQNINYTRITPSSNQDEDVNAIAAASNDVPANSETSIHPFSGGDFSRLSDSIFVPIKDTSSVSSEEPNERPQSLNKSRRNKSAAENINSSSDEEEDSSIRSVRFSKLAEVREMSPLEASEALMSRLSYSASIRVRRQKSHHKTARTALMFSILVSERLNNF